MGRSPCCDKVGLKKGPWTPEEDQKLLAYIEEHGHGSWRALPAKAGLQRCGKSCRLRWTNYLRPDIKRGKFSLQEEQTIIQLHALLGNRWSAIATHLPKRTDNEIKNYWNTHLKKRLAKMGIDPVTHKPKSDALGSMDGQTKNAANLSHMAQWEGARLEAEARLVRESKQLRSASSSSLPLLTSSPSSSHVDHAQPQLSVVDVVGSAPLPLASLCLEVFKGWPWSKSNKSTAAGAGVGLESPTSTLTIDSRTSAATSLLSCYRQQMQDWRGSVHPPSCSPPSVEGFTDLLLNNSDVDAAEHKSEDHHDNNHDVHEDDAHNYWDNILNLVNSSPAHSPLF